MAISEEQLKLTIQDCNSNEYGVGWKFTSDVCTELLAARESLKDKDAEIARRQENYEILSDNLIAKDAELKRLEGKLHIEIATTKFWRDYAERYEVKIKRLEAENAELRSLLHKWFELHNEPCRFDHHGFCQEHFLDEKEDCIVPKTAKALGVIPIASKGK